MVVVAWAVEGGDGRSIASASHQFNRLASLYCCLAFFILFSDVCV